MTDTAQFDWTDSFTEVNRVSLSQRGTLDLEDQETRTDLDTGTEIHEATIPICKCGREITEDDRKYRCVQCDDPACPVCHVRINPGHYCPWCAEQRYMLDKYVYLSLYYLKKGIVQIDDFLQVDAVAGEPAEIAVDRAASVMTEMDYVDTETGEVTPQGRDALSVGSRLYGDEPDIQQIKTEIRVAEVAGSL
ncbi:hypothetical protein HTZ84_00025 [Haloterrigena sp. SYSU A558-1]|uniref:Uncharacterized protein n=1 Tax=Haloterrigena gelatinilytica TaxID=2741724 RepID=A0ABX2L8Q6_9EURY|nr:hypothetical protein [Haloterrigena gelatinilytica]NUC70713.1 hypothetical protein [Haloterrigena gelatinilytica]